MAADPYIDPASGVLANKLGITDAESLQLVEYTLAQKAAPEAATFADSVAELDEAALRAIHHILFRDVYDWAGEVRTVPLAKGNSVFAPVRALHGYADREIFPKFKAAAEQAGADDAKFTAALSECWSELNALHAFREGNGRATMILVNALAHRYGRAVDWRKVSREEELAAAEAGLKLDYGGYETLLAKALYPWERGKQSGSYWPESSGRT